MVITPSDTPVPFTEPLQGEKMALLKRKAPSPWNYTRFDRFLGEGGSLSK